MEVTEREETMLRELRVMEAAAGKPLRAVFAPDEHGVAEWVAASVETVREVAALAFDGKLWGVVIKIAHDPLQRQDQYRWLCEHVANAFRAGAVARFPELDDRLRSS
jgi:hypothetical protein